MFAPTASRSGSIVSADPRTGSPAAMTAIRTGPCSWAEIASMAAFSPMSAAHGVISSPPEAISASCSLLRATASTGSPRAVSLRTITEPTAPVAPTTTAC